MTLSLVACGSTNGDDDGGGGDTDGGTGMDSGSSGMDGGSGDDGGGSGDDGGGAGMDGSVAETEGGTPTTDGSTPVVDSGPRPCVPAACEGTTYACGDCEDNDGDGLRDSEDPDCVGACDDNEAGYLLMIPGTETPNCALDCYFDADQGSGNDGCYWSAFCDPHNRDGRTRPPDCRPYEPSRVGTASCPDTQSAECHANCDAITPNGCDCFGCCELPARSGNYVFLGGTPQNGAPPCSAGTLSDPDSCHPCTPTADCNNTCERCELCLGSTADDLPCDCFPRDALPPRCAPPDGGTRPVDGGPAVLPDGAPAPDGYVPPPPDAGPPPPPRCPDGVQPCGLASDPLCPTNYYCQTGCCTFFG